MSSSKSEADSEPEKKEKAAQKEGKELSLEELDKHVNVLLEETPTHFTLFVPSACFRSENEEAKRVNERYKDYQQKRIGSDNYIARPVQTFNFQHKKIVDSVEAAPMQDVGVFASAWDIADTLRRERKTEFELLGEDLKHNAEREFTGFMANPFSCLSLEKEAITIHSRYQIPGAAEYLAKEREQEERKARSKKTGMTSQANTSMNQVSSKKQNESNVESSSRGHESSSRRQESSQPSNKRTGKAGVQLELRQEQERVEEDEKGFLGRLMERARAMPSEHERRLMASAGLERALKYIDRILNSQTFHKEYICYRNYPEVEFVRKSLDEEVRNFAKKKREDKKEEQKEPLQFLFSFASREFQGYTVNAADWNPVNRDLLAAAYEHQGDPADPHKRGLLLFWTLKNPAFPERVFTTDVRLLSCRFSQENPNLIACGTQDGAILVYDIRRKDGVPIAENRESEEKHAGPVWDIQWISRGKGNKGELLVSIAADGRITEWSMKKGLEHSDLMLLRRVADASRKDAAEQMNFRFAAGLSFEFLRGESSMYLATSEEGAIYRCSKSYTQQYLEVYAGHHGPVYRLRTSPFCPDLFLTCSADWTCKLWNWRKDAPLHSFQSLDLFDEVTDVEWSPSEATLFAAVSRDGRLELWDLEKRNMLDPICAVKHKHSRKCPAKTLVRFCRGDPVLVTGDVTGEIDVYRLNREEVNSDSAFQRDKLIRLLYPEGYAASASQELPAPPEASPPAD